MDPFDDLNSEPATFKEDNNIEIWVETFGRKKNTYLSGWKLSDGEKKDHLKIIKKKASCNGTIKNMNEVEVIQLQGDHVAYLRQYMIDMGIDSLKIKIKG